MFRLLYKLWSKKRGGKEKDVILNLQGESMCMARSRFRQQSKSASK